MVKTDNFDKQAYEWLNENQLSYDIWNKKYRFNNESFEDWLNRVSGNNPHIKTLIKNKKFLFGGRTLANRGTDRGSYSNCYSHGYIEDSLEGIMDAAKNIAMTFKAQGGQGLSLSKIRPKGASIAGKFQSDGIVPFMEIFNTVTESVSQGGSRKGALLMSLDINHPEIETFMTIKSDLKRINKANLSVEIDDTFMYRVESGDAEANRIFNILCEQACKYAEPGVIFTNRFRNYNIMQEVSDYQIETCNPCGEQPLAKHSACNLCSINLSEYVLNPFTNNVTFDYNSFSKDIYRIVEAMDTIIDENLPNHALQEQKNQVAKYRNLGIGVMGIHDMFIKFGFKYGSPVAIDLIESIMIQLFRNAVYASSTIGKVLGSFPGYDSRVWEANILKKAFTEDELETLKATDALRNCSLLSVAPCGSIGTMLNVSTGIEPWFATHYVRNTKSLNGDKDQSYEVWAPVIKKAIDLNWYPEDIITAKDVDSYNRIKMQAVVQKVCDTAISSTINLPKETTPEDIRNIYIEAWKQGLKGITVYVEGSRDPILSTDTNINNKHIPSDRQAPKRPKMLEADCYQVKVKGETFIVLVGLYEGKPYEVFTFRPNQDCNIPNHKGIITKNGKEQYSFDSNYLNVDNIVLAITDVEERAATLNASLALRHGVKIKFITKTLKKVNDNITSFSSAMCRILNKYTEKEVVKGEVCPDCGGQIINEGGCIHCVECGWSKCS